MTPGPELIDPRRPQTAVISIFEEEQALKFAAEEEMKMINADANMEIRPLTANEKVTPVKSQVDWLEDLQGVSASDETDS